MIAAGRGQLPALRSHVVLGLPEAEFLRMLKLTQELFGTDDSEFERGTSSADQLPALLDMFGYTAVRGTPIAAGESVLLWYVSGNRDEDVFDDPFRFDLGRDPNKHLAFGYGTQFCMGAALTRMEVNSFFTQLLPRLKFIELSGDPQFATTTFVGGLKHLPVRNSFG